jgi:hypothetical protein
MIENLDIGQCEDRIESWRRADRYTVDPNRQSDTQREAGNEPQRLVVRG